MTKQRDAHIWEKAKDGFYVEPSWCSRRLFEVERFERLIIDPACGWGTITNEATAAGYRSYGCDIVNRRRHQLGGNFFKRDFLTNPLRVEGKKFSVVTNPPFDYVEEFARQALAIGASSVAMIMLVRRLNAAHWLRELPLSKIYLLTPRPSMPPGSWIASGHKPGGGTQDFCWILISKGSTVRSAPILHWLDRDD